MCFSSTYDCEVTCLNGYLDLKAAVNGTIQTTGEIARQCSVSCMQVASQSSDGGFNEFQNISPLIYATRDMIIAALPLIALFGVVLFIVTFAGYHILWRKP